MSIVDRPMIVATPRRRLLHKADPRRCGFETIPRRRIGWTYMVQQIVTTAPLMICDILALAVAFTASLTTCNVMGYGLTTSAANVFGPLVIGTVIGNALFRLYPACGLHAVAELRQIVTAVTATCCVFALAPQTLSRGVSVHWFAFCFLLWLIASALMPLCRTVLRRIISRGNWWAQPVFVIGTGPHAREIWRRLDEERYQGTRPLGFIDVCDPSQPRRELDFCGNLKRVGSLDTLVEVADKSAVFRGVVAMSDLSPAQQASATDYCRQVLPQVVFATDSTSLPSLLTTTNCIAGTTALVVKERLLLPLPRFIKRLMDLVLVLAGGIVIVPLLVSIAIAIKLTSPGPVFYRQRRLGTDNTSFWAWKFRSMVSDADEVLHDYLQSNEEARREWELDHKLKHDPRVTSVGRLLRKTSLDELPQLWNVLRSEMSLVGPRPIVNAEISKYDSTYRLYSRVKPGITGLWQISGRNDTTYQQRVNYDGYYARNWSPWLDIYILVRTIKVVFFCEGAY